ncbi:PREDICTED: probable tRNA pseudouridine synthase 1 [Nanorana parkeri]|uniref:probable tRNA pseudouridine synthase 1 n=1 Tax=Nanorana parkeri TaxID=125878 RepID=UPI000853F0CD|nr:PREDICTED: probable tRNA pseudouridine synthase 1 [Nanorana parkeri]
MAAAEKAGRLLSLNGLFPVYKPKGPTSAKSLNELKRRLLGEAGLKELGKKRKQTIKIGHGGTLDSSACGVLVVGIGEGTKMLGTMLGGSKKYTAIGELGKGTDTLDASGKVIEEKPYDHITREELEKVLETFTGDIMQVPPLYVYIRGGGHCSVLLEMLLTWLSHHITREELEKVLETFTGDIMQVPPLFVGLGLVVLPGGIACSLTVRSSLPHADIECGGGFYVRSLVRDIGKALSSCASVKDLTRTQQGPFTLEEHALREDRWSIAEVAQALQDYSHLLTPGPGSKRLKTEESDPAGE